MMLPIKKISVASSFLSTLVKVGLLAGLVVLGSSRGARSQVIPDNTLGAESSSITNGTVGGESAQLIEGGVTRGSNLFHSFGSFDVDLGNSVYFASPGDITNIFGRVTGVSVSNIKGRLGVAGAANLFLLNPNGIVFGPGAELDISGSFAAIASPTLSFGNGSEFAVTTPVQSLLSISVPVGLQMNNQMASATGNIVNEAVLEVDAGSDLSLWGDEIVSSVQLVAPDGTARVVGNKIEVRGPARDNQSLSRFAGDTNLSFESAGDITIADLPDNNLLFAPGSGSITLAADADGNGAGDVRMLGAQDALRTRGRDIDISGGDLSLRSLATFQSFFEGTAAEAGGNVTLTAQNNIAVDNIFTIGRGGDSGAVTLFAGGDITTQEINTGAIFRQGADVFLSPAAFDGSSGDGGDISITSTSGDISIQGELGSFVVLDAPTFPGIGGDGGDISIASTSGDISIQQGLGAFSQSIYGPSGNGGTANISSTSGSITFNEGLGTGSFSLFSNSGSGGDISVVSTSGDILVENLGVTSFAFSLLGDSGDGGNISIASTSGDIFLKETLIAASADPNDGRSENFFSEELLEAFASGNSDMFPLPEESLRAEVSSALGSFSNRESVSSSSLSLLGKSGDGGNVSVSSMLGDITTTGDITSASYAGGRVGNGGTVTLSAPNGDLRGLFQSEAAMGQGVGEQPEIDSQKPVVISISIALSGGRTGDSGNVTLEANSISDLDVLTFSGTGDSGDVRIQSLGDRLTLNNMNLTTSGQITFPNPINQTVLITLDPDQLGQSGDTFITSSGNITLNAVGIQSDANGRLRAGNITIESPGSIAFDNSIISSNANNEGTAGEINISAERFALGDSVTLSTSTTGPGEAGNITLNVSNQLTIDDSTIESRTTPGSSGRGGNININRVIETDLSQAFRPQITLANNGQITVSSEGSGESGDINFTGGALALDNSRISATTRSSDGGNVTFNLTDFLLLRNGSLVSTEAGTAGAGGNGGSITIAVPNGYVVAMPNENSDIRANAFEGDGGSVDITARNLLGIVFRDDVLDTPASDITASSQFGNDGEVSIDELESDVLQTEIELPADTAPATVARGCRGQGTGAGSFVSTGRGGLPTGPLGLASTDSIWQDLAPLDFTLGFSEASETANVDEIGEQSSAISVVESDAVKSAIVEAQRWHRDDDGVVILSAQRADQVRTLTATGQCLEMSEPQL